ncbi:hypothetical protein IW261DRAFT_1425392 [Armillaria novae-zelandiae]|uniref:Uncharacterized protein n=1 Tax=Armillaria novae-zelandiae TaxID=153914 RepID=A0AA39TZU9_9AGAR|nr:hypothetical protein IW261DRAFT_1425392 [Armillaria novae-zelandiae]
MSIRDFAAFPAATTYLAHLILLLSHVTHLCVSGNTFSYTYQSILPRTHSLLQYYQRLSISSLVALGIASKGFFHVSHALGSPDYRLTSDIWTYYSVPVSRLSLLRYSLYVIIKTMEHRFTYEHLSKNPTGLLHKRNTADHILCSINEKSAIGPFNGKLGALVEEGWFMVTPNALGLYHPPLGINREMYIQADFRYGADDPLLWPQFYRPKDPLNPFLPLYDSITRSDFSTFSYASQDNQLGTFSKTQRIAIEMRAIMDYITIYCPHMLATNIAPRHSIAVDRELIGVFTTDPIIVEEFYRAKIPVWHLLKLDRLPFTRINAYTLPLDPNQYLTLRSPPEQYKAFQHFTCNHMRLPNPFALVPDQVRSDPPLPEPLPSTSHSKPYDRPIQREKQVQLIQSPSSQMGFLSVIVHPHLPSAVLVWWAAVEVTSSDRSRCYPEARVPEANGYIFPWPDIFIGVQDERKSLELIKAWLCLRPLLLAHVSCSLYSVQPIAHQSWRVILNLDRLMKAARSGGASSSRGTPTKAAKRREQAVDFLQGCAGELQIDADFNVGAAVWRGIELEKLTDNHHREISWELVELNFRFKLFALDAQAATNGGNHDLLLRCLPHGFTMAFTAVDIGSANHGLGHPTW